MASVDKCNPVDPVRNFSKTERNSTFTLVFNSKFKKIFSRISNGVDKIPSITVLFTISS